MISKLRSFFEAGLLILRSAGFFEDESRSPSEPMWGEQLRKKTALKAKIDETYACLSRHKDRRESFKLEAARYKNLQKTYPKDHALYVLYGKRWSTFMRKLKTGKSIIDRLDSQHRRLWREYYLEVRDSI